MTRPNQDVRRRYDAYRELEHLAADMNFDVDAVIVEGPHDQKTLTRLGCTTPILQASHRSPSDLVDFIAKHYSYVAVLTDFDEEGDALNRRLAQRFHARGVNVNRFYRRRFRSLLTAAGISTIEGVYRIKLELHKRWGMGASYDQRAQ